MSFSSLEFNTNKLADMMRGFLRIDMTTKEQYIPPERQGKRGKYDPGPVFGTSIDFLRTEFDIQKFFDE